MGPMKMMLGLCIIFGSTAMPQSHGWGWRQRDLGTRASRPTELILGSTESRNLWPTPTLCTVLSSDCPQTTTTEDLSSPPLAEPDNGLSLGGRNLGVSWPCYLCNNKLRKLQRVQPNLLNARRLPNKTQVFPASW